MKRKFSSELQTNVLSIIFEFNAEKLRPKFSFKISDHKIGHGYRDPFDVQYLTKLTFWLGRGFIHSQSFFLASLSKKDFHNKKISPQNHLLILCDIDKSALLSINKHLNKLFNRILYDAL